MRNRHIISSLTIISIALWGLYYNIRKVEPQTQNGIPLYIATQNQQTLDSTIWAWNGTNSAIQSVFVLQGTSSDSASTRLSDHELSIMNSDIQAGFIPASATSSNLRQEIQAIWAMGSTTLLFETSNFLCYTIDISYCFGYYE